MTPEEIKAKAEKVAQKMADRMIAAYVASVEEHVNSYISDGYEPDEDDFFSWAEGYDWAEE